RLFCLPLRPPPLPTLFPYTTLFRSRLDLEERRLGQLRQAAGHFGLPDAGGADHDDVLRRHLVTELGRDALPPPAVAERDGDGALDRKSTRLNSSHVSISYAVFCLKK